MNKRIDLPKRIDVHCHSSASNEADEALLTTISCPESFSLPTEVYAQAKRNGMDFVTITDHDTIAGVTSLLSKPDVVNDILVGEELTCYFPEDRCKIHLLVWGLDEDQHTALQKAANNMYDVADIIADCRLAHSVAHPVYRQNDRLSRWHLERLALLFKGFETLNGAHSPLHRRTVDSFLDELTADRVSELARSHRISPRWPAPHIKSRTAGSDDHGLFNIGRTFTEFPGDVRTIADLLECLREARCTPGGEAGSSLKLAHNFYGVGIRYHRRKLRGEKKPVSLSDVMFGTLIGEQRSLRKRDLVKMAVKRKVRGFGRKLIRPFTRNHEPTGTNLLTDLFLQACQQRIKDGPELLNAIKNGRAALGEHQAIFDLISAINRDIAGGIKNSVSSALGRGEICGIFDSVSSIAAHQFFMMPYYFALFHQNRERKLLPRLAGCGGPIAADDMKLGVFTDTFDEINGVSRFIQDISRQARGASRSLIVHTCCEEPKVKCESRRNFPPMLSQPLPFYKDQPLTLPPLIEILEWADRQQFDAIHVHTPGPMGLCGWLVAKMLRVPLLGTYHTDFPRYVHDLTQDHRLTTATTSYMQWFYGQTRNIFSRSRDYVGRLEKLGFENKKIITAHPGVDTEKFATRNRDSNIWSRLGVKENHKLLYAGRVSLEKNLPFLVETIKQLSRRRSDVALVVAGDGPYRAAMEKATDGLPVYYLGFQNDEALAPLYASSDLFVFPSKTDTLGQVVVEAQASGLPVVVSDQGGPRELTDDQITGLVLPTENAAVWSEAIHQLLEDTPRRMRMSRTAPQRTARFSQHAMFESFWSAHLKAVNDDRSEPGDLDTNPAELHEAALV